MEHLLVGVVLAGVASANSFFGVTPEVTTNCPCGWSAKERIVGGKESTLHAYPFVVSLVKSGRQFCGATILTRRHLVTAAHCTIDHQQSINEVFAVVGAHSLGKASPNQYVPIKRMIQHPAYNNDGHEAHDIAIVLLRFHLRFRREVGPICLPNKREIFDYKLIRVLGWGLTTHEGSLSDKLMEVDLQVIPHEECEKSYPNELQKFRSQICTYGDKKDSCQGDSGGPLVVIDSEINRYFMVGLVSFGKDCASENPAVNTDITFYLNWIKSTIEQTSTGLETCRKVRSPFGN